MRCICGRSCRIARVPETEKCQSDQVIRIVALFPGANAEVKYLWIELQKVKLKC